MNRTRTCTDNITIKGMGSSVSFTNGAAIVMLLETKMMMLQEVARTLKGRILSSSKADWNTAVNPTWIVRQRIKIKVGTMIATNSSSSLGSSKPKTFC